MRDDVAGLFAAFTCGSLTLSNRFVMSPMTRNFSPGGVPGDDVAAYYSRRAMAKVGLIITEGVGVDHPSAIGHGTMGEENIPVLHGAAALAGWRKVVDGVHSAGGKIIPQLWHMGELRTEGTPPHPQAKSMRANAMSESEIADVIGAFLRSAANAKAVGFDGIALHGGHGYLIDSFLWAETNARDDGWGGDTPRRTRFAAELVKALRAEVGPDFPILFRISQWKLQDYEAKLAETPEELALIVGALADAGDSTGIS
jgi:2,4-dienoyl-CoA reductase-like NADH-dependent reductase (Old Yellow Enzyme family)